MPVFAASITKSVPFQGEVREFSNVYHYLAETEAAFDDAAVVAALVAAEKPVHGTEVEFIRGRTWGPTDGPVSDNLMREVIALSGPGTGGTVSGFYRELAIMLNWPLGRYGSRNRPQFLRKWLHTQNHHSSVTDYMEGIGRDTTLGTALSTYASAVSNIGALNLCTKDGRVPIAAVRRHPYLEHRQLGR